MSAGKGSAPRNCFSKQYRENWDQIFPQRRRGAEGAEGVNAKDAKTSTLDSRTSTQTGRTVPPHPEL